MSDEEDDEAERQARLARAERIHRRIDEAARHDGPPRSPREFTDRAAGEAAQPDDDSESPSSER